MCEEWLEQFEKNGYLVIENFLSENANNVLTTEIENITSNFKNLPERLQRELLFEKDLGRKQRGDITPEECGNAIFLIGDLMRFGNVFKNLLCYGPLLDVLESLFKSTEFEYHFSNATIKSARVGSKISWHRDCNNKYMRGLTTDIMRPMLCLDGMTLENGATQIIKNSHKVTDEFAMNDKSFREEKWKSDDVVTLECPPGALVILHSKIVHGGAPNRSENPRRNIIFQFGGEGNFLVTDEREMLSGMLPRSKDPQRVKQNEVVFKESLNLF